MVGIPVPQLPSLQPWIYKVSSRLCETLLPLLPGLQRAGAVDSLGWPALSGCQEAFLVQSLYLVVSRTERRSSLVTGNVQWWWWLLFWTLSTKIWKSPKWNILEDLLPLVIQLAFSYVYSGCHISSIMLISHQKGKRKKKKKGSSIFVD